MGFERYNTHHAFCYCSLLRYYDFTARGIKDNDNYKGDHEQCDYHCPGTILSHSQVVNLQGKLMYLLVAELVEPRVYLFGSKTKARQPLLYDFCFKRTLY